ncbi:MAG: hypothetical protein WBM09_12130 [Gallionella sp.]
MYEVIAWRGKWAVGRSAGVRFFYEALHPTRALAEQHAAELAASAADNPLPICAGGRVVRMWKMQCGAWCVDRLRNGVWELVDICPTRHDAEQRIAASTKRKQPKPVRPVRSAVPLGRYAANDNIVSVAA